MIFALPLSKIYLHRFLNFITHAYLLTSCSLFVFVLVHVFSLLIARHNACIHSFRITISLSAIFVLSSFYTSTSAFSITSVYMHYLYPIYHSSILTSYMFLRPNFEKSPTQHRVPNTQNDFCRPIFSERSAQRHYAFFAGFEEAGISAGTGIASMFQ